MANNNCKMTVLKPGTFSVGYEGHYLPGLHLERLIRDELRRNGYPTSQSTDGCAQPSICDLLTGCDFGELTTVTWANVTSKPDPIDDFAALTGTRGDIIYYNAPLGDVNNGTWEVLPAGAAFQSLQVIGGVPTWAGQGVLVSSGDNTPSSLQSSIDSISPIRVRTEQAGGTNQSAILEDFGINPDRVQNGQPIGVRTVHYIDGNVHGIGVDRHVHHVIFTHTVAASTTNSANTNLEAENFAVNGNNTPLVLSIEGTTLIKTPGDEKVVSINSPVDDGVLVDAAGVSVLMRDTGTNDWNVVIKNPFAVEIDVTIMVKFFVAAP